MLCLTCKNQQQPVTDYGIWRGGGFNPSPLPLRGQPPVPTTHPWGTRTFFVNFYFYDAFRRGSPWVTWLTPPYSAPGASPQCWIHRGLSEDIDLMDPHPQIVTYRSRPRARGREQDSFRNTAIDCEFVFGKLETAI